MASDNSKTAPGMWVPDYSVTPIPVRQNFRHEYPELAALIEYSILLAIVLGLAVLIIQLWKFARRQ